ncbi:molybdopterin cofactor-binding domain-containing protein [Nocardioides iriomotensis]|uniref:Xanthine dehydrogenase family protein molybdopterin-binding subunit n=1 Tax=Nocardioides iriomotensis TaxID=715784 RepID=A0A4Q5ISW0_9ACTN|nr:molybdopterin cofactor-binding domain-containing protein [Nocardioides iriomotensis]RYU08847.1 xanthine dehydrogenase family protein molybdopterin-binding subunit [Nocardioides iriomotensis]
MTTTEPLRTVDVPPHVADNPRLGQWISFPDDLSPDAVGVRIGKVELGQGIVTALAQVAADALALPVAQVRMLNAHTGLGPDEGLTAGSLSMVQAGPALRYVGAVVRDLVARVADDHPGASFVDVARTLDPATDLATWEPRTDQPPVRRVVGTDLPRLDLPDKVLGRPRYLADLRPAGLRYGRALRPPSFGATLVDVDAAKVEGLQLVRDGSFVGVVAATEAEADAALVRLREATTWDERDLLPDEHDLTTFLKAGPHDDIPVLDEPDAPAPTHTATYTRPFLAHASIAPSCGLARWSDDGTTVHVWSHSQGIHNLRAAIATSLGLDAAAVTVEHVENAGCYGHNAADDAAFDAVLLARSVPGTAVQVRWSRRDELAWGPLASAMVADLSATLAGGRVTGWRHDVWSQGHSSRPGYGGGTPGLLAGQHRADPDPSPAAGDPPPDRGGGTTRNAVPIYDVGPRSIAGHRLSASPLRTSAMRALGAYLNVFAIECFMDELAEQAGTDPVDFRLAHLADERARAVIERARDGSGWGTPLPDETGRGIGFARYKDRGAWCAVVAEVTVDHEVRVRRLTIAVDVGLAVSPDGVRNQIEGGATQATSWTTRERVRFDRRRVTSDDWETYPILRFSEAPLVDVHVIDRPDQPSLGAGEAAQGPTAAAIANAVHAALGVRVRDLPLTADAVVRAIEQAE